MGGKTLFISLCSWSRRIPGLIFRFPVLFCLLLAWFYWGSCWYPAATLSVNGTISKDTSKIAIWWESGHGLNEYERKKFSLTPLPIPLKTDGIPLTITRTGRHSSASLGAKVDLSNIFIDGEKYLLPADQLPPGVKNDDGMLVFKKNGASLQLTVHPKSNIVLEFPAFNGAGKVDVQLGGTTTQYDLYASNNETQWGRRYAKFAQSWFISPEGEFTVAIPMVRYPTNILRVESKDEFSVTSVTVATEDGTVYELTNPVLWKGGINFGMHQLNQQLKRYYHPDRFLLQILFALLTGWLLVNLFSYGIRFSGLKDIFINEQRYLFWLMLFSGCFLFSFWHISFWPGVTSNDSLEIWRAAQIPGMYLGDHPPLNVILYIYLSMFWNNVAVVPIVQNLLTSLLTAYIFFSLYRKGLPLYFLLPFYGLVVFSLPVGLYTIILWKDVPFALLVVFLGFKLACFYFEKQNNTLSISRNEWLSLFILTLMLAGIRHNGVLYLFIVPFIIVALGIVRIRPVVLVVLLGGTLLAGAAFFFIPGSPGSSGYLAGQTKVYLNQAMKRLSVDYLKQSGKYYLGVFDINQKRMQWDHVGACMYGRYTYNFLKYLRWNDVYPYLPFPKNKLVKKMKGAAWILYQKSYTKPWVYFSWNPVYMLFLFPLLPLLIRKLPMTAVFSFFIIAPMSVLVFLNIFNWRYYFFAYLASYFLLPMIVTDISAKKRVANDLSSSVTCSG